jgi:hypothetical protein
MCKRLQSTMDMVIRSAENHPPSTRGGGGMKKQHLKWRNAELKVENERLRIMVEQLTSSVEEVTLLKRIVEEQKEELGNTKLRILEC